MCYHWCRRLWGVNRPHNSKKNIVTLSLLDTVKPLIFVVHLISQFMVVFSYNCEFKRPEPSWHPNYYSNQVWLRGLFLPILARVIQAGYLMHEASAECMNEDCLYFECTTGNVYHFLSGCVGQKCLSSLHRNPFSLKVLSGFESAF